MVIVDWARSKKADLVRFQQETGIPALWAAAQMCHESAVDGGEGLSELAARANNYAGLKWAEWEREFGCKPVRYDTWEVIDGQTITVKDAFCSCSTWEAWLKVYGSLLTGDTYGPALAYAADPLLYGFHVWQAGWATDPNYMVGVGNWMARLYDDYKDTVGIPVAAARQVIPVVNAAGKSLCEGWLDDGHTVAPVRPLLEGLGLRLVWDGAAQRVVVEQ